MLPAIGTLLTSERTLYTAPAGRRAEITWLVVDNPTAAAGSFKMYLTVGNVRVGLTPTLTLNPGEFGEETKQCWLSAGDSISGSATVAGLTYIITGQEHPTWY